MKFYKTKKLFFCVFTYLILYKKVLKYVQKKNVFLSMEIRKYFLLLKKKLKPDLFLIMGLSPAPGVKY